MRQRRRAEALGSHYKARLHELFQATQVAFVIKAEGFSPTASGWRRKAIPKRQRRRAEALGSHYEARLRGLTQAT